MLTAPPFRTIEGVTVYADDSIWYRFYPVAAHPDIRLDKNERPVFLLVKYAFSDQDREDNPDLPSGGGYLNFDVEFSVPPETLETVREDLQEWVDEEWNRLRNGTREERNLVGVRGTTEPPSVEIASPTWTSGSVALDAPQSELLVTNRVAEGTPSLLQGNIAVFSMDLTSAGATFMQRILVGEEGDTGSDLTPVQVSYDLTFWARTPPARIRVHAESEQIYKQVRKIMDGRGVDHCTTYDFAHTDITTAEAEMANLIDVQIDTGAAGLEEDVIDQLRDFSLELIQSMIEDSFFQERPLDLEEPIEIDDDDERDEDSTKKYLKESFDSATMTLDFELEQSSVVEWPIHPQSTLQTFFEGMAPEELDNFVREISLDDEFFQRLGLEARVFADFDDPVLSAVEVQIRYRARDAQGERVEKNETFTFVDTSPQTWNPALVEGKRSYEYRWRVGYAGQGFGEFSEWQRDESPDLNIAVASTGRVEVDVVAGNVDFEKLVQRVQVTLAYEDPAQGIAREEEVVILDNQHRDRSYSRDIFADWNQPLQYRLRFDLQSGEVLEDQEWSETVSRQLLVNQPFMDVLEVDLLPAGTGWPDVSQVFVDLRYSDPANNHTVEETLSLKSRDEFRTWKVVLQDKNKRDFEYRVTASFKDGTLERGEWQEADGSGALPVHVEAVPKIEITLVPTLLDFEAAQVTEVTLNYDQGGVNETETFVFTGNAPQTWRFDAPENPPPLRFTYTITHFPQGEDPVRLPEQEEEDPVLVLPPHRPPESGSINVQVIGTLVNFDATPLVTVDLEYEDEVNDVQETASLTFDQKGIQTWAFQVKDVHRRLYGYLITYFDADGQPHPQEKRFQNEPRVIIPNLTVQEPDGDN
ncbi:MAG TPA: hypothetical protein VLV83_11440 [Acidobacteriota bacterium]|nr:hypothetical protein [Acidobacteriota bacterium]